jgi:ubiquinone/menaquinone biosynthesis C-methylase UbiE
MTTRPEVVAAMLRLAGVKPGEVVYDLGCGDGRIPVAAVKQFGAARGLGIDFNADRIRDCERSVAAAGLTPEQAGRLMFKQGDVLKLTPGDFAEVDVVTLYLLSSVNDKLAPVLRKGLKPGARVVSNSFEMGDWKPDREEQVPTTIGPFRVMLWTIPSTK